MAGGSSSLEHRRRVVIGLTGSIACGKSTVLGMLRELGARTVDADELAHAAIALGGPVYGGVVERFGSGVLLPGGEIDRRALGSLVFSDPEALRDLEALIHPVVRAETSRMIAETDGPLVIDAIKLLESSISERCDEIWVVTCDREQQVERLQERNGYSREEALLRIDAQPPQEEKVARADVVIRNDGPIEATGRQVHAAWQRLLGGQ